MVEMAVGPLLLTLSLSLLTTVHCGVFVVAPNVVNANEQETVSVLVTERTTRTSLTVTIQSHGQVHDSVSSVVTPNVQKIIKVRVDGSKLGDPDIDGGYYVQLRVQCASCGNFDKMTDILVNKRTGTVFLQTDKPIYSPGQTVFIQVFALDENRNAADTDIRVEIKNPQGIIVTRESGHTETGIFSDVFRISDRSVSGVWKTVVHFGTNFTESREKPFEVKMYVLPRFQVKLSRIPEYIASLNNSIEGYLEARYSLDTAVVGKARVVFRVVTRGEATYLTDKTYNMIQYRPTKFRLEVEETVGLNINNLIDSKSHLQIEAIVTETSTGISERVVAPRCHFATSPYIISFEETPANFMPGMPFGVKIMARYITGTPLVGSNLVIRATDDKGRELELQGYRSNNRRRTNSRGEVQDWFDIRMDTTAIRIRVNVEGDPKETEHMVHRPNMPGYMKISPYEHLIQPGLRASFETVLTDGRNLHRLQFMLVSGGRISDVGHETRPTPTVVHFNRYISYKNVPSVRVVAWYFRTDNKKLVAASTKLQVERHCKSEAEVKRASYHPKIVLPGTTYDMIFRGAIGAKVETMVVDKSVYFMNNESRLTRKTFFDEFETHDLGCAVGGGANATDVFTLAGLTVLSDTVVSPQRRESLHCTQGKVSPTRGKRSTNEPDPDDRTCCNAGEQFANRIQVIVSSQQGRMVCFTAAGKYTSRSCKNSFGRCCTARISVRASGRQDYSITHVDYDYMEMPMIEEESAVTVRTDFPESWMFSSDMEITTSGETRKTVKIPDSITTWVFQAVTMSTTEGMCVAKPFKQVARKDLFLKLHLPHSAILGEQIELAATVYNLARRESVRVSFLVEDGLCSDVPVGSYSHQHKLVEAHRSWTARWPIVPTKTGQHQITIKLYSSVRHDIVVQNLNVVPSGDSVVMPILQTTQDPSGLKSDRSSWNGTAGSLSYTVWRDTTRRLQITNIPLKLPQDALSDTTVMKVSLLGDVMTPIVKGFLHGTERHLHRPTGYGEQTMSKLGPLVFTARYLRQQRMLTGSLEVDTRQKIEYGVQNMLRYRKSNGGFAAFANREHDNTPKVWLTAFALKTLTQAREFINIDNKVIDDAKTWLMTQSTGGMFTSGRIWHTDMAGGARRQLTQTAYVYISLLEAGYYQQHQRQINQAMNLLALRTATENDSYALAIVTYALAKFGHPQAETVNQRLLTKARNLRGQQPVQTYWPTNPLRLSQIGSELEVETAAYGLLAQLALGRVVQSNSIVEWLLRQRYAGPHFRTTQSTVLSLQALSEYSAVAVEDTLDMTCTLSFPDDHHGTSHIFNLTEGNRLVQQTYEVTEHIGHLLIIRCEGTGVAHATVETTYYSAKTQQETCAFTITAEATPKNNTAREATTIKVCTRQKNVTRQIFMPMVEVGLGTGFKPLVHTLESLLKRKENKVDFYEVNDRSVVLYMKEIPSHKDLCLKFDVTRDNRVNYTQPVPVKVYAYYEPDKTSCRTFYDPLGETNGLFDVRCSSTTAFCKCLEKHCAPCYGYASVSSAVIPPLNTVAELVTRACSQTNKMDYVHVGRVQYTERKNGELKHTILIENVNKPGTESREDLIGNRRVYTKPFKCAGCRMEPGRRFLIMGLDGLHQRGTTVREYQLTASSYVVGLYRRRDAHRLTRTERRTNKIHKYFIRKFKGCM